MDAKEIAGRIVAGRFAQFSEEAQHLARAYLDLIDNSPTGMMCNFCKTSIRKRDAMAMVDGRNYHGICIVTQDRDRLAARVAELEGIVSESVEDLENTPCQTCGKPYSEPEFAACVSDHRGNRDFIARARAALAAEGGEG